MVEILAFVEETVALVVVVAAAVEFIVDEDTITFVRSTFLDNATVFAIGGKGGMVLYSNWFQDYELGTRNGKGVLIVICEM